MAQFPWHAFFYDTLHDSAPARTAVIEAEDDVEAGRIARAQMGGYARVELARPVWAPQRR
jgi:hypothetical protein